MSGYQPGPPPPPPDTTQPVPGPCECGGWQTCACAVPVTELRWFVAQLADLHAPAPHQPDTMDLLRCRAGEPLVTCPIYRKLSRLAGLRLDRRPPLP
jgi:hypothetical protein